MDGQACLRRFADIRWATDSEQLCCELFLQGGQADAKKALVRRQVPVISGFELANQNPKKGDHGYEEKNLSG